MFSKTEIVNKINLIRDKIRSSGIIKLALFGSCVRGEQTNESDIDLLVEFEGSQSFFRILHAKEILEKYLGYNVDLVTEDSLSKFFKEKVMNEMEVIYHDKV